MCRPSFCSLHLCFMSIWCAEKCACLVMFNIRKSSDSEDFSLWFMAVLYSDQSVTPLTLFEMCTCAMFLYPTQLLGSPSSNKNHDLYELLIDKLFQFVYEPKYFCKKVFSLFSGVFREKFNFCTWERHNIRNLSGCAIIGFGNYNSIVQPAELALFCKYVTNKPQHSIYLLVTNRCGVHPFTAGENGTEKIWMNSFCQNWFVLECVREHLKSDVKHRGYDYYSQDYAEKYDVSFKSYYFLTVLWFNCNCWGTIIHRASVIWDRARIFPKYNRLLVKSSFGSPKVQDSSSYSHSSPNEAYGF